MKNVLTHLGKIVLKKLLRKSETIEKDQKESYCRLFPVKNGLGFLRKTFFNSRHLRKNMRKLLKRLDLLW